MRILRCLLGCITLLVASTAGLAAMPSMIVEASVQAPDGHILVAGESTATTDLTKTILVGRLNPDGTTDAAFGANGWASYVDPQTGTTTFSVTAMAVSGSGEIILATRHDSQIMLLGFTAAGAPDPSFGSFGDGSAPDSYSNANESIAALHLETDGSLLAIGSLTGGTSSPTPLLLHYVLPYGYRDTGFGNMGAGELVYFFGAGDSMLRAAAPALPPDTGFYAVGYARTGQGDKATLLVRFLDNGSLDYGFQFSGYALQDFNYAQDDEAFGVTLDGQGNLVVTGRDGHAEGGQNQSHFLVSRFLPSGDLDNYFGVAGHAASNDVQNLAPFDSDSTAVAAIPLASGNVDVLGTVIENSTGRSHFGVWVYNPSLPGYNEAGPVAAPIDAGDDSMTAAFAAANGELLAVGTRDTAQGDIGLRALYFADDGTFDTDFPVDGTDDSANPLALSSVTGATSGQEVDQIFRVSGINVPISISVVGGEYSLDCTTFTSAAGTVTNGQTVCLRAFASTSPSTTTTVEVDLGSAANTFTITTDSIPDTVLYSPLPANPSGISVTFHFGSTVLPVTYQCSLDGAAFSSCGASGSMSYSGLTDGAHTFQVSAVNSFGADPTPASFSWTVQAAPDTTITATPASPSAVSTASFSFTSTATGATFECKLDSGAVSQCTSPQTYSGLSDAAHTFSVYSVSASGAADPTPASYSWTVDAVPPDTSITSSTVVDGSSTSAPSATFAFQSTDAQLTGFECSTDGGAFAACTSPVSLSALAQGAHSFAVRARSIAQVDPTPASRSWTVDTTAPDVTITSGAAYGNPAAAFTYSSTDPTASFNCKVDSGTPFACFGTTTASASPDGVHTFSVQAQDAAGNVSAWASRQWTVDTVAPDISITSGPGNGFTVATNAATFAFSSTDSTATFKCQLDNGALALCTSPASYSGLADGRHTFFVEAIDPASNSSSAVTGWTIDTVAPDTTITSAPAGSVASTTATITFTTNETGNVSFLCQLDGGAPGGCVSPMTYSFLAQGSHTVSVTAQDLAGNKDPTPATATWSVDTIPPGTTITSGPQSITQLASATFTLASNESGATFTCQLDGSAWAACNPAGVTYQNLLPGQHTFSGRATDLAGNVDPAPPSQTWTVDYNYGPDTSITGGPSGTVSSASATFTFTSTATGSTFQCSLDAGAATSCASPFLVSGLTDGQHTFAVAAVDPYGDVDRSPATVTWTVDTVSPDTTITAAPSGTVAQNSATVSFASNDPSAGFQCQLDGAAYAACTTPATVSGLSDGTHTFFVRAIDLAGNVDASPASATWAVDTTAPNTTISSGPASITNQTGASFQFSSGEGGDTYTCSLDGAAFSACTSPVSYAGLAAGAHTFRVEATDAVGNVDPSPASWNWTIDTTPPDTSITSGPSGRNNSSTATFGFSSTEPNSTFQCKLDSGGWVGCVSTTTYAGLASGSHTFSVAAIDPAGNVDPTPATRTWSVK
jgi:uncharacterized delta-60 repeat protein